MILVKILTIHFNKLFAFLVIDVNFYPSMKRTYQPSEKNVLERMDLDQG